jgi:hypothetical protein
MRRARVSRLCREKRLRRSRGLQGALPQVSARLLFRRAGDVADRAPESAGPEIMARRYATRPHINSAAGRARVILRWRLFDGTGVHRPRSTRARSREERGKSLAGYHHGSGSGDPREYLARRAPERRARSGRAAARAGHAGLYVQPGGRPLVALAARTTRGHAAHGGVAPGSTLPDPRHRAQSRDVADGPLTQAAAAAGAPRQPDLPRAVLAGPERAAAWPGVARQRGIEELVAGRRRARDVWRAGARASIHHLQCLRGRGADGPAGAISRSARRGAPEHTTCRPALLVARRRRRPGVSLVAPLVWPDRAHHACA